MDNTNIVERLRADMIEALQQQLAAETKNKQQFERDWLECCDKLAASQAREKVMHSLSNELLHQIDINDFTDSHGHSAKMLKVVHDLMKYNTQPSDDTALKAAIQHGITEFLERTGQYVTNDASRKAALKEERERVAKHFEPRSYLGSGHQLAVEIRALEDE